jgi:hypothetical protein
MALAKAALAAMVPILVKPILGLAVVAVVAPAGFSDLRGMASMAAITVAAVEAAPYPVPVVPAQRA